MKKRLLTLFIIMMLLLSFFGCTSVNILQPQNQQNSSSPVATIDQHQDGYDRVESGLLDFSMDLYSQAELTKGYETLENDAQRECYQLLQQSVFFISQEQENGVNTILPVTLKGKTLSEAQLHLVISAFIFDNPQIFWIDNSFSYYSNSKETYLQLCSNMTARQVTDSAKKLNAELREIFSGLPGNLSLYDRELFVHDKLIERCEYADEATRAQGSPDIYTCLGAIVDNVAVCEGYSRGAQLMLSLVGIESYYVYGRGNNELHMWNSVCLEDKWYYMDVTWDDKGEKGPSYNYFNITSQQALAERTISPHYNELSEQQVVSEDGKATNFNLFIPVCSSDNMSFYSHSAVTVTGFDEENINRIAKGMVDAVNEGKTAVYLYIDPNFLNFENAKNNLFYSGDYAIFTCIDRANEMLYGKRIGNDYVSTEASPELSVLTVYLEY